MIFLIFIPLPSFGGIGAIFSMLSGMSRVANGIAEADRCRRIAEGQRRAAQKAARP